MEMPHEIARAVADARRGHRITEWEDVATHLATVVSEHYEPPERVDSVWLEVLNARAKANHKHGENSIEALDYWDPRFLPILMEEVGELAHVLTYDGVRSASVDGHPRTELEEAIHRRTRMREELVDVLAVASAWLGRIDEEIERNRQGR